MQSPPYASKLRSNYFSWLDPPCQSSDLPHLPHYSNWIALLMVLCILTSYNSYWNYYYEDNAFILIELHYLVG